MAGDNRMEAVRKEAVSLLKESVAEVVALYRWEIFRVGLLVLVITVFAGWWYWAYWVEFGKGIVGYWEEYRGETIAVFVVGSVCLPLLRCLVAWRFSLKLVDFIGVPIGVIAVGLWFAIFVGPAAIHDKLSKRFDVANAKTDVANKALAGMEQQKLAAESRQNELQKQNNDLSEELAKARDARPIVTQDIELRHQVTNLQERLELARLVIDGMQVMQKDRWWDPSGGYITSPGTTNTFVINCVPLSEEASRLSVRIEEVLRRSRWKKYTNASALGLIGMGRDFAIQRLHGVLVGYSRYPRQVEDGLVAQKKSSDEAYEWLKQSLTESGVKVLPDSIPMMSDFPRGTIAIVVGYKPIPTQPSPAP